MGKKRKRRSCKLCLWNWPELTGLPKRVCYCASSPKRHQDAIGGCTKYELCAPASIGFHKLRKSISKGGS